MKHTVKHTLKLERLDDRAVFVGWHQLVELPDRRQVGTEPFGPHRVQLTATMYRADWEAAGCPIEVGVDL